MKEIRPAAETVSIRAEDYAPHADLKHLFLVGNLQRPTPHPFVRDERLEFIVCLYEPGDDGEPHWHPGITEYEIVIEGRIGHYEAATGETRWCDPGDFNVVPAGVCVKRIVPVRSRTIAVKVPSSPACVVCEQCERDCRARIAPFVREEQTQQP
jgi:hypothetical protein